MCLPAKESLGKTYSGSIPLSTARNIGAHVPRIKASWIPNPTEVSSILTALAINAPLAEWIMHRPSKATYIGSSPMRCTKIQGLKWI